MTTHYYLFAADRNVFLNGPMATEPQNFPGVVILSRALSQINRFTGHTTRPYSVAEHSVRVTRVAMEECRQEGKTPEALSKIALACLLHDLHEAVVGDVSYPVKKVLGATWTELEERICKGLYDKLGVSHLMEEHAEDIKYFDLMLLATEKRDLLNFKVTPTEWDTLKGVLPHHEVICPMPLQHIGWHGEFVKLYVNLCTITNTPMQL